VKTPRTLLGARLRDARLARGLTQEALSTRAGMSTSQRQVTGYETGASVPTVATLCRLADALEVSMDWLLGRTA